MVGSTFVNFFLAWWGPPFSNKNKPSSIAKRATELMERSVRLAILESLAFNFSSIFNQIVTIYFFGDSSMQYRIGKIFLVIICQFHCLTVIVYN